MMRYIPTAALAGLALLSSASWASAVTVDRPDADPLAAVVKVYVGPQDVDQVAAITARERVLTMPATTGRRHRIAPKHERARKGRRGKVTTFDSYLPVPGVTTRGDR